MKILSITQNGSSLRGLGDVAEKIAHPVAVALGLPCLDKTTKALRPDSPCAKRRDAMNRMFPFKKKQNAKPATSGEEVEDEPA